MRYGKQRATLTLLFCVLPIVTAFAFLQTPYVSELVLKFSLRMVRFKTGVKVEAQNWSVRPITFSAALEDVTLRSSTLAISIPEFRVQLSPLSLLVGNLQIRKVQLSSPQLEGSIPARWLQSDGSSNDRTWVNKDIPKFLGENLARIVNEARVAGIGFEKLILENFSSKLEGYLIESGNLEVENLEGGQAKLEWSMKGLEMPGKLARVRLANGNLALIQDAKKEFFMVLSLFQVEPETQTNNLVDINGRWPGDLRLSLEVELKEFFSWFAASPALGDLGLKNASGTLAVEANVAMSRSKIDRISSEIKGSDLVFDEYSIKNAHLKSSGNLENLKIETLKVQLATGAGDDVNWKNLILSDDLTIESGKLKGLVRFDQMGLCTVLKATDTKGCLLSFPFSGPATVTGDLKPFNLLIRPNFLIEGMFVNTEELVDRNDRTHELLSALPITLTGDIQVGPKSLQVSQGALNWNDTTQLRVEGKIEYDPTVVDMVVEAQNAHLDKMFSRFLDLSPSGSANIAAKIFYSSNIPEEVGQTRILGRVTIEDFGVEGQNFGTIVGPINYASRTLRLGPLRLTNGGGKSTLDGTLVSTKKGSFFNIGAVLDRLELSAITPETKSEVFRGFVSGTATLRGYTDSKSPEALSGPLDLKLDTFKVFGIPFQKGSIKARYANRILELLQVVGTKEKSTMRLKGALNPAGGSELLFSTDEFRVKDLALSPSFEVLQDGLLRIDGFWRPSLGWGVDGKLSKLKIGGVSLPDGPIKLSGNDKTFSAAGKLGDLIEFDYETNTKGALSYPSKLKATLKDVGLYGVFAYLKGWLSSTPVQTSGELKVDWTPNKGFLRLTDLEIKGPQGQDGKVVPLISVSGEREIAWTGSALTKNTFSIDGPLSLKFMNSGGGLTFQSNIPLAFLDLFIPNLRFIEGVANLRGEIPLPPDVSTLRALGAIETGTIFIRGVGQPIQNANAQISINRQQLTINNGRGDLGGGEVTLNGVYKIDLNKPGANLQIGLNRAHVVVMEDVPADVTGELVLKGEEPPYLLGGRVQVSNVLYGKEFKSDPIIVPPNVEPILKFGLDIELGSNVQIKNSLASIFASGRMLLKGSDLEPDVAGKVNLLSGFLYANETEFKLIQGTVDLPGGVAPALPNIQANTLIKSGSTEYKIDLRIRGNSLSPIIELSSEPYLASVDILNLLLYGTLRSSESNLGSDVGGAMVEAIQMVFNKAIGASLERSTGVKLSFKSSQVSETGEVVPRVTAVKKLSDRMTLTIGGNVDLATQTNSFQLDYKLLNNVNLSGVYEKSSGSSIEQKSSLGMDLRFRFEVK
jgi:hypothetical protein